MRKAFVSRRIAILALASLSGCRPGSMSLPEARADPPRASSGVAVVELFTSEGCSSCPPADQVLAELAATGDPSVYPLAFHVDYWDDLGWRDRFATSENTARQQSYARAFGTTQVYTPQLIVNGTEQFTGSDRDHATRAVRGALTHPAAVAVKVEARGFEPDAVTVDYQAPSAPEGSMLTVAVVERADTTTVGAGENAGRTLHHANVVRGFRVVPLAAGTGSTRVVVRSLARTGAEVIGFVQRPSEGGGMAVLGAGRAPLRVP